MVAAAPSGSESVDKACTTQLSLHRGAAPMKLTADSHTHRIVTERDGDQRTRPEVAPVEGIYAVRCMDQLTVI